MESRPTVRRLESDQRGALPLSDTSPASGYAPDTLFRARLR